MLWEHETAGSSPATPTILGEVMKIVVMLVCFVAVGCRSTPKPKSDYQYFNITTPKGYKMTFIDFGTIRKGYYTAEQVGAMFDKAVDRSIVRLGKYGAAEQEVINAVKTKGMVGVDHFQFESPWSSTGFAAGDYDQVRVVRSCLYKAFLLHTSAEFPADSIPRTCLKSPPNFPGNNVYGWLNSDDDAFLSLHHELGHVISRPPFGTDFEHWPKGDPRYVK